VTNVIAIREGYLTALVGAFLIELAGAVIAIFKSANFFGGEKPQISVEDDLWNSIRKLDTAFGYLETRLNEQMIYSQSELLSVQMLTPTPRTDIMALAFQIKKHVGKVDHDVIKHAVIIIANVLEKDIDIGAGEKATLVTLCKALPPELAGEGSRLLDLLQKSNASRQH
jgi:hypothetical protein